MRHTDVCGPLFLTNPRLKQYTKTLKLIQGDKIVRFQNGSKKVAIVLRVLHFWTEIILVILNRSTLVRV